MSELKNVDLNSLYGVLFRETENETIQELDSNFYISTSEFIGKLKSEDYDGVEAKIKTVLVNLTSEMITLLLKIRLEKASKSTFEDSSNLLDTEKFILSVRDEIDERKEMILSATLNGKSKFLESTTKKYKIKLVAVRFLKEMDQIVGADLEKYGPFKAEDVASIPFENAQALFAKKIATKIHWED